MSKEDSVFNRDDFVQKSFEDYAEKCNKDKMYFVSTKMGNHREIITAFATLDGATLYFRQSEEVGRKCCLFNHYPHEGEE